MSPNPSSYATNDESSEGKDPNCNGNPPVTRIGFLPPNTTSDRGFFPIPVPTSEQMPNQQAERGVSEPTEHSSGVAAAKETSKKAQQPNGIIRNGKSYAAVRCEDDLDNFKNASIKCKPGVNCFKLREYQKEHNKHLSLSEQSMFFTAIAELEQVKPRSRLANCEVVFFGPDPDGFNPVFFSGKRRNKYLCVWQEDRQSAMFIAREEPTNYMSRHLVTLYFIVISVLLLLGYQYWLIKHLVEVSIDKFQSQPLMFTMTDTSVLTLRAKILGPQ